MTFFKKVPEDQVSVLGMHFIICTLCSNELVYASCIGLGCEVAREFGGRFSS